MRVEIGGEAFDRLERIALREGVSVEVLIIQAIATWSFLDDRERNEAALAASRNALRSVQGDQT